MQKHFPLDKILFKRNGLPMLTRDVVEYRFGTDRIERSGTRKSLPFRYENLHPFRTVPKLSETQKSHLWRLKIVTHSEVLWDAVIDLAEKLGRD